MSAPPASSGTTDHGARSPEARVARPPATRQKPSRGAASEPDADGSARRRHALVCVPTGAHADVAASSDRERHGDRRSSDRPHDAGGGGFDRGDVDLAHLQHRLHGTMRAIRIGVADELDEPIRDDLPRESPPVLQPAARLLLPAVGDQGRPVAVDLLLVGARDVERDRLGERELRSGIHRVVVASARAGSARASPCRPCRARRRDSVRSTRPRSPGMSPV